jgi:spore coat protein F
MVNISKMEGISLPQPGAQRHLAWHETMELHELVAYQSNCLIGFKREIRNIQDPALRSLYSEAIAGTEQNIRELLQFYPSAPTYARSPEPPDLTAFYSGHLLGFAKTSVRNYALAITETATPQVRDVLQRHLLNAIHLHGKVFAFMNERGYYPAYDIHQLLDSDIQTARKALSM